MKKEKLSNSKKVFILLLLAYVILVFTLPVNKAVLSHYRISSLALHFIDITYVVPLVLIWITAYYGYSKISQYSSYISGDKDGKQMHKIALGIGVFAFGQPSTNIISSILNAVAQAHIRLIPTSVIIDNYLSLAMAIVAFLLLSSGAAGLVSNIKAVHRYRDIQRFGFGFVIVAAAFCYLMFHNTLPNSLNLSVTSKPIYYLPNWLLLFSLVVPYLFVWFMGGMTVVNIHSYQQNVKGIIYKSSMSYLRAGISLIVVSLIVLQYLTTVSSRLANLKIAPLLLIIYPLIILVSIGYILVALGAKKLQKIEES